ncbi:hypothetical protein E2C01_078055 [Portunus trituberculatus]|uniref:Uncharacterized protein n=1 Tax=Portunus trituberculatus TaxID=210409 RepID=A0A5B7IP05_PORTR|nr:hypothetical protein [Portunus trituberculatus]
MTTQNTGETNHINAAQDHPHPDPPTTPSSGDLGDEKRATTITQQQQQ